MKLPVLTAVTGAWEAPLVSGLESAATGVAVVRRCVDLADLLASAASGRAQAVILSADLRRLDRDALAHLATAGLAVVGLHGPGEEQQGSRLRALGVTHVLPADAPPEDIAEAVETAVRDLRDGVQEATKTRHVGMPASAPDPAALADPAASLAPIPYAAADEDDDTHSGADAAGSAPGQVIAVWGPAGAPGRTTVAVTLAAELAALGEPTLLVDADTYAASVAQTLGVLDEAPGLAAACRAASTGSLGADLLARLAPQVTAGLRILTGIGRSSRWPEVGATALEAVWPVARQVARWVVVDCGFCLERDEELSFDTAAPRRNAATLAALEEADVVLAVGAGDPVGLQRLVRGLSELREVVPSAAPRVVVTRVRSSAVGSGPQRRICEALGRYAGVEDPVLVPDDRAACDAALLAGRSLTEHAPSSPARRALAGLAAGMVPATASSVVQPATETPPHATGMTRRRLRGRMTG